MRFYSHSALLVLMLIVSSMVTGLSQAMTNTSEGGGTGEGSTQFTGLSQAVTANQFTGAMSTLGADSDSTWSIKRYANFGSRLLQ